MPDMSIPGALVITIGVIACFGEAMHTGNYKYAAIAGIIGTVANLVFFYRRLYTQLKAENRNRQKIQRDIKQNH